MQFRQEQSDIFEIEEDESSDETTCNDAIESANSSQQSVDIKKNKTTNTLTEESKQRSKKSKKSKKSSASFTHSSINTKRKNSVYARSQIKPEEQPFM